MELLLKYAIFVEPDRQRLSRFVLSAVEELGGNMFSASMQLNKCMAQLYSMVSTQDEPIETRLLLDHHSLYLETNSDNCQICSIPVDPDKETIKQIKIRLSHESELADPELLRQRNTRISEDLEKAKALAAEEMAQLEKQLESRRIELEQAQKEAETDSLTGLFNRGAYDTRLQNAIARCQRQNESLCLLMLDVDNFKQINDSHGHLYGDEYLKKVAEAMEYACRKEVDHCCRLGGDEFALIVYANLATTERVAKTILKEMDNKVSIGVAQMLPNDTPTELASRCDSVMYEAKENGRGQFVSSHITVSPNNNDKRAK